MTNKSWTPEKIENQKAIKQRNGCIGWGLFCSFLAYVLAHMEGTGGYPLIMMLAAAALFYAAYKINIWKVKRAEGALYK